MNYGLIGEHLGHSYSKLIQEKLLDNYTYDIHEVAKEELDQFMTEKDFKAINVTIPYKRDVIPYLNSMDDAAMKIGAVNTIVNKDGVLEGHNTDYYGFRYMVEKHGVSLKGKKVLVLGNGGASQAIQAVVRDLGAKEIIITDIVLTEGIITIDEAYEKHPDVNVIMNTTPVGMYPRVHGSAANLDKFPDVEAVFDCIYNPMDTEITLTAKEKGIRVAVTGLEMLVGQAKRALEFFKDIEIDDSEIDRIYREILLQTANCIVYSNNIDACKQAAIELGKEVIFLNANDEYEANCIASNKLLVISDTLRLDIEQRRTLKRNGVIVESDHADIIVKKFKDKIAKFNN